MNTFNNAIHSFIIPKSRGTKSPYTDEQKAQITAKRVAVENKLDDMRLTAELTEVYA